MDTTPNQKPIPVSNPKYDWEPKFFVVDDWGTYISEHKTLKKAKEKMKKMPKAVGVVQALVLARKETVIDGD